MNPAAAELRYDVMPPPVPDPDQPADEQIAEEARRVQERLAQLQAAPGPEALVLDLAAALQQAQRTGREYLAAEEDYILSAIRLLIERHAWSPRLFHTTSVNISGSRRGDESDRVLRILNELVATQRLPFGGEVAARWIWDATEDLRSSSSGSYRQASSLVLDASIPLLRDAGMIAQESLIQAERSLVYAARDFEGFRRRYLVDLATDYFNLLQRLSAIENTEKQLASLGKQLDREMALFQAERVAEFRVNIVRSELLSATSALAGQREAFILALDRFKIRIGLPVQTPVLLAPAQLEIPEPDLSLTRAVEAALLYRLDLQNVRDRLVDSLRDVRNTRNQLLPDLDLRGSVTFLTDPDDRIGGIALDDDHLRYSAGLTFSLPLDREIERLRLRTALINHEQRLRDFQQFRDNIVLSVRAQVREIERARFALLLEEERVKINLRRQLEQSLKPAAVTSQELVDTENALNAARNARDQALTDLRNSILQYLVVTGQLRVDRQGRFMQLPGMEDAPAIERPRFDAEPPDFPPPGADEPAPPAEAPAQHG